MNKAPKTRTHPEHWITTVIKQSLPGIVTGLFVGISIASYKGVFTLGAKSAEIHQTAKDVEEIKSKLETVIDSNKNIASELEVIKHQGEANREDFKWLRDRLTTGH